MATATRYADQMASLLPEGKAWDTPAGSVRYRLLQGLTDEWVDVAANADQIHKDAFPQTTETFLPDWQRIAGLPDTGEGISLVNVQSVCGTTFCGDLLAYPERNIAVLCTATLCAAQTLADLTWKLGVWGGASIPYWCAVATAFGTRIKIVEKQQALCGVTVCGEPCGGWEWNYVWEVRVSDAVVTYAKCGTAVCGDPLYSVAMSPLVYWIQRFKPAHTFILWQFLWYYVVDESGNYLVDEHGNRIVGVI